MLIRLAFLAISIWTSTSSSTDATSVNSQLHDVVEDRYQSAVSSMLDILRRVHRHEPDLGTSRAHRERRSVHRSKKVYDYRGVFQLTSVEPMFPVCSHNAHFSWTDWNNQTYGVCISNQNAATLGVLKESSWSPLNTWDISEGQGSVVFHSNRLLFTIVADKRRADGADLLRYNFDKSEVEVDHTIHCRYPTAITLWRMPEEDGNFHLAIANSHGPDSDVFQDLTYTYDWRGTYFDHYFSVQSYDVVDLEAYHIYGQTYLAVANRKSAIGTYEVDSEIFRFDIDKWRWRAFQKIRTRAVSDVHFFEMGPENAKETFFVVANQFELKNGQRDFAIDSVIYKFVGGRFVPFQCLRTHGASGVSAFSDPQTGIFLLAVANLYSPVQLYQYNGWNFITAAVQFDTESMTPGARALSFRPWKGMTADKLQVALVVSNPRKDQEASVFALSFSSQYSFLQMYSDGREWCKQANQRLDQTKTSEMVDILQKAQFANQDELLVLQGPVIFQGGLNLEGTLQTTKVVDLYTGRENDYALLFKLESLQHRLFSVKNRIANLKKSLSVALRTSGDQIITGQIKFENFSASCTTANCEIQTIDTVFVNGQNVEDLKSKVVFLNQPNKITGSVMFQELSVEGNVHVAGFVDGINVSHIVTRDSNRVIQSQKTFLHTLVASNINVKGTLDTVEIHDKSVLLTEGDQEVYGESVFTEMEVENIQIDGTVNGVNLHEFYEDVVLIDSGVVQRITGPKTLKGPITFQNLHLETGKINGVDLVDLWNNAIWLDTDQSVNAQWNFSQLALTNPDVSTVNGVVVPGPVAYSPMSTEFQVSAHLRFTSNVVIDKLEVETSLNGLGRIESAHNECPNQLDMVLKNCDQTIYGFKNFGTVVLGGRSHVKGTLNDFDLAALSQKLNRKTQHLEGNWVFQQVDVRAPVLVKGDLVGWLVEDLYNRALKLDQPLPLDAKVTFKNVVQVERLVCTDLNDVDIQKDLFLRHGNTVVNEKKQWDNLLLLDNTKAMNTINAFDINFLKDVLRNGPGEQVLQQHRIIEGDLVVNSLDLGGTLSGLDVSGTIQLNTDVTFSVPVHLENAKVESDVVAGSVVVSSGIINGQHFLHTLNNTMIHSLGQRVLGKKTITGQLIIPEGENLDADLVNGIDLKALQKDTLYSHEPQDITGNKTFLSPTRFHNLFMNSSINGISVWELFNNFMLQDVLQTVSSYAVFNGGLKVDGKISIDGRVNGMDISHLEEDIIRKDHPFNILGDVILKSAHVVGDINLTGKVQGVDLSAEAVKSFSDNTMTGKKTFRNMLIHGDLLVDGTINGVNIRDLCQFAARKNGQLTMDEVVVRGNVKILGDLHTDAPINDLILQSFKDSVVLLNESYRFHNVKFSQVVFEQLLVLHGELNGFDLGYLHSNYMSLSRDQNIPAKSVFNMPVIVRGSVYVGDMIIDDEKIGDLNVVHLVQRLLTSHSDQIVTSKYIIQGDLFLTSDLTGLSSLNGLNFPENFALKSRPNEVVGPVIFSHDLIVTSDLELSRQAQIQGVDITEWTSHSVMTTGRFTLTGVKGFNELHLQDVRALDLFGGTHVSTSSILLKEAEQYFTRRVSFGGAVKVGGSLDTSSEINGVNVPKLIEESVLQSRPSVISGRKTFVHPLKVSRLSTLGFVANVNVTELALLIQRPLDIEVLHSQLRESSQSVTQFNGFLKDGPQSLSYYEKWFQWKDGHPEVLAWDYLHLYGSTQYLIVSWRIRGHQDCSKLVVYVINGMDIVQSSVLPSSFVVKVQAFSVNFNTYIVASNAHGFCSPESGGVQIFSLDTESKIWSMREALTPLPSSDVSVLLSSPGLPCVASALPEQVLIHCFDHQSGLFTQVHEIPLPGVLKVSFTTCKSGIFLAASVLRNNAWYIHLFLWEGSNFSPLQVLLATYPAAGPLLIGSADKTGKPLCLLVVAEGSFNVNYSPETGIFRFDPDLRLFLEIGHLPVRGVVSVQWNKLSSGAILLSLLNQEGVSVYRWTGLSGFVFQDFFRFLGGRNLLGFSTRNHHYLAVSGLACDLTWWQSHQPINAIFAARIKGI